ncbi:MAG: hypothetical protein IK098_05190 [Bacteroidales bacterium]|nr:hypothetical protein [Bacteroidales bacterium]
MLKAIFATAFTAAVTVGCTGLEPYTIDAPDDLAEKIAAYKAEKEAGKSDDYEEIAITTAIVGAEDNTSGWWTEFSQYFYVPSGKKLFIEFENFGSGANNWNNWNVCVANGKERETEGYTEYFVLRSDWYGWGNADYAGSVIEFDYGGGEVNWDEFREKMQGAHVTMSIDHARAGAAYLEVHSVATDGFDIVEKYNQTVSATEDINVFLIADGSHFNMKKAWLVPSEIAEIPDFDAESISVMGYPITVPLGNEDYWGDAVATVTFADGFTTTVAKEDLTITEPDMTTLGMKTVAYTYNLTKLGKPGKAVLGYYNFEVTDLASIAVTKAPVTSTYYLYDQAMPFFTQGLEVTGTKGDGSTVVLDNAALTFDRVQPVAGTQDIEIRFSDGISTSFPVNVKMGTEAIGLPDFTNGWWSTFLSADKPVPAGESVTVHLFLYSDNLENWHSPCTILRKADMTEYGVVRMDSFGWGAGYDGNPNLVIEHDWNFDVFAANQNMSAVSITVTNNGDNTADIRYNVTYANGETHFQQYSGITVDSADLQMGIVTEESYLIVLESAAVDAKLTGIEASAEAYLIGGAKGLTLAPEGLKVNALYSDGSKLPLKTGLFTVDFADGNVFYAGTPGTVANVATVSYTDPVGAVFTAPVNLTVKASEQAAQADPVGAEDFSNGWWTTFSNNWNVPAGTAQAVSMAVKSDNAGNWHSPCVILRKADGTEYCVVRMDNYGWGGSYDETVKTSNWNWDTFQANIDGSQVDITVANDGNGTASIRYHVVYANGEEHFQFYDGLAVDSADVTFAIVTEESYLIFD